MIKKKKGYLMRLSVSKGIWFLLGIIFLGSGTIVLCKDEAMAKKLEEYSKKRDFKKTPEPKGRAKKGKTHKPIFVIQQHHASHMHYDFRLEINGVLKSWAVPKGPSTNPQVKRLAALTEDHPLEYANFEGIIPQGYGAGSVIVWDKGTYDNLNEKEGKELSMAQAFKNNHIKINLNGKKLQGAYALTRFKDNDWLLVKVKDEYADTQADPVSTQPESVLSKKTVAELDEKKNKKEGKGAMIKKKRTKK
jgi:DNA ligase D-like protein (predicted 3'-phosphoesterase)